MCTLHVHTGKNQKRPQRVELWSRDFGYNCLLLSNYFKLKANILSNSKLAYEITRKHNLSSNGNINHLISLPTQLSFP